MDQKSKSISPTYSLANLNIGSLITMNFDDKKHSVQSKMSSRRKLKKNHHPKNNLHNNFDVNFLEYQVKLRRRQA